MTRPEKYNFKVKYNQFGQHCANEPLYNFEDISEEVLINCFEQEVLDLKASNTTHNLMIELGSNNCFYSMLYRQIMAPIPIKNIMVEPYEIYMNLGKEHFELNGFNGEFLNRRIFTPERWCDKEFQCDPITIDNLFATYNLSGIDVLHCDIDGAEIYALEGAKIALEKKLISLIFLCTHSDDLHVKCKDILTNYSYNCILDHPQPTVGYDRVLVFDK